MEYDFLQLSIRENYENMYRLLVLRLLTQEMDKSGQRKVSEVIIFAKYQ